MKVTPKGRDFALWVKEKQRDPTCDTAAVERVKRYRREAPNAWCLAAMTIMNGDSNAIMLEMRK